MKRKNRKLIVLISGLIVANIVLIAVICALFYSKQQKAQSLIAKAQSAYKQADYQGALDCLDKLSDAEKKKPENLLLLAKIEAITKNEHLADTLAEFHNLNLTTKQKALYANELAQINLTVALNKDDYTQADSIFAEQAVVPLDPQLALKLIKHDTENNNNPAALKMFKLLENMFEFDENLNKYYLLTAAKAGEAQLATELFHKNKDLYLKDNQYMMNLEESLLSQKATTLLGEIYQSYLDKKMLNKSNFLRLQKFFKSQNDTTSLEKLKELAKELNIVTSDNDSVGNTQGNILNSGIIAKYKNTLYFPDFSNFYLTKTDDDFANKTVLLQTAVNYLNVTADNIYFVNRLPKANASGKQDKWQEVGPIKRVDLEGQNLQMIYDTEASHLLLEKGYLYFIDHKDGKKLKRIAVSSIDMGEVEVETVVNDAVTEYALNHDKVVYAHDKDHKLHLYDISQKQDKILVNNRVSYVNMAQDRVYYINMDKSSHIECYSLADNKTKTVFNKSQCSQLNVIPGSSQSKDMLLFEKLNLARMRGDGNDYLDLTTDLITHINFVDKYIYYYLEDPNSAWEMYRQEINGGKRMKVVGNK